MDLIADTTSENYERTDEQIKSDTGLENSTRTRSAAILLRLALATAFLSAVADRFGLWGGPGEPGVAWGDYASFLSYTGQVLSFLPAALTPMLGFVATVLEVALAVALIVGFHLRRTAAAAGLLLSAFALSMTLSFGPKAALDYSVFTAAAAAWMLAVQATRPASVERRD